MLLSTILAVALGYAPVKDGATQIVRPDRQAEQMIGRYRQTVDKNGRTHVRGFDRLGRAYDLTLDQSGDVEGTVGTWDIAFHVEVSA